MNEEGYKEHEMNETELELGRKLFQYWEENMGLEKAFRRSFRRIEMLFPDLSKIGYPSDFRGSALFERLDQVYSNLTHSEPLDYEGIGKLDDAFRQMSYRTMTREQYNELAKEHEMPELQLSEDCLETHLRS